MNNISLNLLILSFTLLITNLLQAQYNDSEEVQKLKLLLQGQTETNLKPILYSEICRLYTGNNLDSALHYGNKSLELFHNAKASYKELYQIHYNLGVANLDADLNHSRKYLSKSLDYAQTHGNDSILAANYLVFSTYYSRVPKLDSSIYFNVLASEIFQKRKDSMALAYCYYTSMSNYNDLKNTEKSLEYGILCHEIAKKKNIDGLLSHVSIAIGFTYTKMKGKDDLANKYINEAKLLAKASNNYLLLSHIYLTLGSQKSRVNNYKEAIVDYNKAYQLSINNNDELNASRAYSKLAKAYYKLEKIEEAVISAVDDISSTLTGVVVYPNPMETFTQISIDKNILSLSKWTYSVTDVNGRVLEFGRELNHENTLNCTDWAAGVYFINVSDGKNYKKFKLVKVK